MQMINKYVNRTTHVETHGRASQYEIKNAKL